AYVVFNARSAVSYFNERVRCVSADRAPTCPVADRQKTKPSDREAQARRGDRDPPTPMDTAERSARARGERARCREHRHSRLWPVGLPPSGLPKPHPYGAPAPWPNRDDGLSESRCLRPGMRQRRGQRSNRETLTARARRGAKAIPVRLDGQPSADDVARGAQVEVA